MTNDSMGILYFSYHRFKTIHSGAHTGIYVTADSHTGEVLAEHHPDKLPRGASLMAKWHLPIHFGEFGGLTTRILWFIVGLMPAFLTYTGLKIWWVRGFGKKRVRLKKSVS